jgi:hypothetical protein
MKLVLWRAAGMRRHGQFSSELLYQGFAHKQSSSRAADPPFGDLRGWPRP